MTLLRGLVLPRKSRDKQSAEDQISSLARVYYLASKHCMKGRIGALQPGPGADYRLACGCIGCQPELYCRGTNEQGGRCEIPADFPPKETPKLWCCRHYRELLKAEGQAGVQDKAQPGTPAPLQVLMAAAGKAAK
jgi:hypothetical protein